MVVHQKSLGVEDSAAFPIALAFRLLRNQNGEMSSCVKEHANTEMVWRKLVPCVMFHRDRIIRAKERNRDIKKLASKERARRAG